METTGDQDTPPPVLSAVPIDPLLGRRVLGDYVIARKLGEGGMGAVYLLESTTLPDTFLALKVLHATVSADPEAQIIERFRQEALAAAAVGSHRVVKPIATGQFDGGMDYIVMEYVPGRSLAEELRASGPLDVVTALQITARIADTMVVAHQKGIIHRDLKPANVMLHQAGERDFMVKLLDFGVARTSGSLKLAHTGERGVLGTPGYLSPEAALGRTTDGRSDVFSLGVILYRMLTGEMPFGGATSEAAILNVIMVEAQRPSTRRPAQLDPVPPAVDALVAGALTKEPSARLDMAGFHGALREVLEGVAAGPDRTGPGPLHARLSLIATAPAGAAQRPTLAESTSEVEAVLRRVSQPSVEPPASRLHETHLTKRERPEALAPASGKSTHTLPSSRATAPTAMGHGIEAGGKTSPRWKRAVRPALALMGLLMLLAGCLWLLHPQASPPPVSPTGPSVVMEERSPSKETTVAPVPRSEPTKAELAPQGAIQRGGKDRVKQASEARHLPARRETAVAAPKGKDAIADPFAEQ